jgi:hypothetical protein
MRHKLKILAGSLDALRAFLFEADIDLGCRPIVNFEDGRVSAVAFGEDEEVARLNAQRDDSIAIKIIAAVAPTEARLAMVSGGNRCLAGELPRGFGEKS